MKIDIVTIFPSLFEGPLGVGLLKRALDKGLVDIQITDLRLFSKDKHRTTDDYPFGGGPGMVMKIEPIFLAIESLRKEDSTVILLSPQGRRLDQEVLKRLSGLKHLILLCGRYKGVDERVRELTVDDEISIGDYVLTGGEMPALVLTEGIVRLLPGAMDSMESALEDSFEDGLLDSPRYTRPREFRNRAVPDILISGDHAAVSQWRRTMALKNTAKKRPDLLERAHLTEKEKDIIEALRRGGD
jgi:tRNA (guanine37-N1)-methyltransferase